MKLKKCRRRKRDLEMPIHRVAVYSELPGGRQVFLGYAPVKNGQAEIPFALPDGTTRVYLQSIPNPKGNV